MATGGHTRRPLRLVLAFTVLLTVAPCVKPTPIDRIAHAVGPQHDAGATTALLDAAVERAVAKRDRPDSTRRQRREAFAELFEAAGLRTTPPPVPAGQSTGATAAAAADRTSSKQVMADASHDAARIPGSPGRGWWHSPGDKAHPRALREVAWSLQMGLGVSTNLAAATALYRLAAQMGDPMAHGQMGLRYALGLADPSCCSGGSVLAFGQPDDTRALLHYSFGAAAGDTLSLAALADRHRRGAGVPRSCRAAARHYRAAAEAVLEAASRDGGLPHVDDLRLEEDWETRNPRSRVNELMDYLRGSAARGSVKAQTTLGKALARGAHGFPRDPKAARHYLEAAAAVGGTEAAAALGHLYASGAFNNGVPDFSAAAERFATTAATAPGGGGVRQAAVASASVGRAFMALTGMGAAVGPNPQQALPYFQRAADAGDVDAHYFLGVMYRLGLGTGGRQPGRALHHTEMAAYAGHPYAAVDLATWLLVGSSGSGTGSGHAENDCWQAVELLKEVAERGRAVGGALQDANEAYYTGHYTKALLLYLTAAEAGSEIAQSNAAWLLDRSLGAHSPVIDASMHARAAEQASTAAALALGDAYLTGYGLPQDLVKAAMIYHDIIRPDCGYPKNAEALFRLGLVHMLGAGVPRDLDLAWTYFDIAEAALPEFEGPVVPTSLARTAIELIDLAAALATALLPPQTADALAAACTAAAPRLLLWLRAPPPFWMHWRGLWGRVIEGIGLGELLSGELWADWLPWTDGSGTGAWSHSSAAAHGWGSGGIRSRNSSGGSSGDASSDASSDTGDSSSDGGGKEWSGLEGEGAMGELGALPVWACVFAAAALMWHVRRRRRQRRRVAAAAARHLQRQSSDASRSSSSTSSSSGLGGVSFLRRLSSSSWGGSSSSSSSSSNNGNGGQSSNTSTTGSVTVSPGVARSPSESSAGGSLTGADRSGRPEGVPQRL